MQTCRYFYVFNTTNILCISFELHTHNYLLVITVLHTYKSDVMFLIIIGL
jgi:hypothetical protein